jgi:hypothetical protein
MMTKARSRVTPFQGLAKPSAECCDHQSWGFARRLRNAAPLVLKASVVRAAPRLLTMRWSHQRPRGLAAGIFLPGMSERRCSPISHATSFVIRLPECQRHVIPQPGVQHRVWNTRRSPFRGALKGRHSPRRSHLTQISRSLASISVSQALSLALRSSRTSGCW